MSVPAVRRIVVGVDSSAGAAAAFRWACREAALRGSEVHAVHVREAKCHGVASYASASTVAPGNDPVQAGDGLDIDEMWQSVLSGQAPEVAIRTEVIDGLPARVLLEQCAGAEMLILGTSGDMHGQLRSAGPVIRACLRRASCAVVVISVRDPGLDPDPAARDECGEVAPHHGSVVPAGSEASVGGAVPVGV